MSSTDVVADIEKHGDAIVRVCSYHRLDFELAAILWRPREINSVQASLQTAFEAAPTAELGILSCLPAELTLMVLRLLDVRSFFRFRQVNRQARVVATRLWEYELVSKHGLEGLRGLLRAELAHLFTIDDLYRPLTTDKCVTCGGFGEFLFLFTAERCCFDCLRSSTHYRSIPSSACIVFTETGLMSERRIRQLSKKTLRTVPNIYDKMKMPKKRPQYLIHEEHAKQLRLTVLPLEFRNQPLIQLLMTVTAYPSYSLETAEIERGVSCKGCQVRLDVPHRRSDKDDRDRVFSAQGFLSHFSHCVEAQHLWAESEGGTRPVNEPKYTPRPDFSIWGCLRE